MKRTAYFLFCFVLCLFLFGCSSHKPTTNIEYQQNENGESVIVSNGSKTLMAKTLPAEIKYNDTSFSLASVDFYELYSNYQYYLYIVVTLDFTGMPDSDLHWLKEEDLSKMVLISSKDNDLDYSLAHVLGTLYDGEKAYIVFTSSFFDSYRYSFVGSDISVSITAKQKDTYEYTNSKGKVSSLHKEEEVHYTHTISESLPSAEDIPEPLYSYVVKWLNNESQKRKSKTN